MLPMLVQGMLTYVYPEDGVGGWLHFNITFNTVEGKPLAHGWRQS